MSTTRPDQLPSPHGYDPRVVVEHVDTGERRVCFPVDAAEFLASGQWRRVTTLQHDPARDGAGPLPPTGGATSAGEGAPSIPPGSGAHARLAERDRIAAAAAFDGKPPAPPAPHSGES